MRDLISKADAFRLLAPGDLVMADDQQGGRWQGCVDETAHELGIVWILTDRGERKLLDVEEHTIS